MTTNIVRRLLIEYTQSQCQLHGIRLKGTYPTGRYWDIQSRSWRQDYAALPVVKHKRLLLVPKYTVRRTLALNAQEYYSHHVVNFIQDQEFSRGSLVRVLKNGDRRPPFKKVIKKKFPFSKDFLARFSDDNPQVLKAYKKLYSQLEGAKGTLSNRDFEEDFDEAIFARALQDRLRAIPTGTAAADEYHTFIVGVLEFVFWPNLIYPVKESPIHDGRKRIDVTYTNAAKDGFFYRAHTAHQIASTMVMVECKNYSSDPANPEVDQLSGRFSVNRGKLGLLLYRGVNDYKRLCARCRDTASDGRGIIIPLGDVQVLEYLELIERGNRAVIDQRLEQILNTLIA